MYALKALRTAILTLFIFWLLGFSYFAFTVITYQNEVEKVDAIIVLTGGPGRIPLGHYLLKEGYGSELFISGAGSPTAEEFFANDFFDNDLIVKINWGYEARTTKENSQEIAAWANRRKYNSFILVTSSYHLPRSLLELQHTLPDATFIPYVVKPKFLKPSQWFKKFKAWHILFLEYNKLLSTFVRQTFLTKK